ncbi:hypothetical protein [Bosea sp. ASV33]|uniref:hypothetical protein n=1 Tax=Bosea sp. ASV33 TaxID=2795106 RepID=UPI0018EC24AC|nr:hypothetical protein [Bosea sp. ASV33]
MAQIDKKSENPARLEDVPTPIDASQSVLDADLAESRRVSDRTNVHDAGSDANDTPDGLTESEEAVRQAAEDVPVGRPLRGNTESIPVFDRGSLPPKI